MAGQPRGAVRVGTVAVVVSVLVAANASTPSAAARPTGSVSAPPAAAAPPLAVPSPTDRYALALGCWRMDSAAGAVVRDGGGYRGDGTDAEPFHLQPTDLGIYLLFDRSGGFLAGRSLPPGVVRATEPSPDSEWVIEGEGPFTLTLLSSGQRLAVADDGTLTLVDGDTTGPATEFTFTSTDGCAAWPEVEVNVTGEPLRGGHPVDEVRGYLDAHLHWMAFEFLGGGVHCGQPWHRYGVTHALVDCPDHQPNGAGAVLENILRYGQPVGTHDPVGWPTFRDWPAPDSLTHEQTYHRWVERAWRGGLRLMTVLLVENRVLCEAYPIKRNACDEMDSVRLQAQRIRELERYIDALNGGPGRGWFRIVTDPFEARKVINEGKLAVVLGIEVSELFGCRELRGQPLCTREDVDRQLEEVWDLGVRQMELVNKFDNALSGVAGDAGATGVFVNTGNLLSTGRFWDMQTCPEEYPEGVHDKEQMTPPEVVPEQDALFGAIAELFLPPGTVPVYPDPPHCNTLGLSDLGAYTIRRMAEMGMIFDPDHMSVRARMQALDVVEELGYSGVVSSHSWATSDSYPRIYRLGGVVTPYAGDSTSFVDKWRTLREQADPRFYFGFGYGADANGLGAQGDPRGADVPNPVTYPFQGLGGVTIDRQRSGERIYDINVDGVAHYGLYPDWIEDLRMLAGDAIVEDLARGAEAYLQMWERAVGVPPDGCRPDVEAPPRATFEALRPGMGLEEVLRTVGQPRSRQGGVYTFCTRDAGDVEVVFDADCRLIEVRGAPTAAAEPPPPLPATGGGLPLLALALLAAATWRVSVRPRR